MSLLSLLLSRSVKPNIPPDPEPIVSALTKWKNTLETWEDSPVVIAVAGDSLTDMDAASIESSGWSPRLARKISSQIGAPVSFYDAGESPTWDPSPTREAGVHLVNVALSGRTSYSYLSGNALANLIASRPHLVTHQIGVNNYSFTSNSPVQVVNDIAGRVAKIDADLLALGHPAPIHALMVQPRRTPAMPERAADWWDVYSQELRALAGKDMERRILVDVDSAFADGEGLRTSDGIHLTAEGYELTASVVFDALNSQGPNAEGL